MGEGGAAPPIEPDEPDDEEFDDDEYEDDEDEDDEPIRAEPWQPDASLMRAFGLELDELGVRLEAGDSERLDAAPLRRGDPSDATLGANGARSDADAELVPPAEPAEERPPWW